MIKYNNNNNICPIFIITSNKHNKILANIKKFSNEIKLYQPSDNEMKIII